MRTAYLIAHFDTTDGVKYLHSDIYSESSPTGVTRKGKIGLVVLEAHAGTFGEAIQRVKKAITAMPEIYGPFNPTNGFFRRSSK